MALLPCMLTRCTHGVCTAACMQEASSVALTVAGPVVSACWAFTAQKHNADVRSSTNALQLVQTLRFWLLSYDDQIVCWLCV